MLLLLVVALLPLAQLCSLPPNTPFYTPTQRTILAPLVVQAQVLNVSSTARRFGEYEACIRTLRIFKDTTKRFLPREFCFGKFGPEELCLSNVYPNVDYVFFLNEDRTARYDGFPLAVLSADMSTLTMVNRGHCLPRSDYPRACERPRIDRAKFKRTKQMQEGESAELSCPVLGTGPFVVRWQKRGDFPSWRLNIQGNSLELLDVSASDAGSYICQVSGPAGEITATVKVTVFPKPCGDFFVLKKDGNVTITSPRYPSYYPRDKMCTWRICPARRQRLEFSFKAFNLRRRDRLEIHNECDSLVTNRERSYCSSTSPGVVVSQCHSRCVQIGFISAATFERNYEARGFQALVTSTNKDSTLFDYKKLYCENDLLVRFQPTEIQISQNTGNVLNNYKSDSPKIGDKITIYDSYPFKGLFGCDVELRYSMQYFIGAKRERGQYRLTFAMLTGSLDNPINFENNLNNFLRQPPTCR